MKIKLYLLIGDIQQRYSQQLFQQWSNIRKKEARIKLSIYLWFYLEVAKWEKEVVPVNCDLSCQRTCNIQSKLNCYSLVFLSTNKTFIGTVCLPALIK